MTAGDRRFRCKIVGLKYFPVDFDLRASLREEAIQLRPNPQNKFDKNAVMVLLRGVQIGHIDKESAVNISQLFRRFQKYKCEILGFDSKGYWIDVIIHAEIKYEEIEARRSLKHKGPCLYRLWVTDENGREKSYIGQTGDLANRLIAHERDLNLGTHPNYLLLDIFNRSGAHKFQVEVLEKLTMGLPPIQKQISLLDSKRKYIRYYKKQGASLNIDEAFLVTTFESEAQYQRDLKEHADIVDEFVKNKKRERREINGKINALKAHLHKIQLAKCQNEQIIRKNSGLRRLFLRQRLSGSEMDKLDAACREQAAQIEELTETTKKLEALITRIGRDIRGAASNLVNPDLNRYRHERDAARRQNQGRTSKANYRDQVLLEDALDDDDDDDDGFSTS